MDGRWATDLDLDAVAVAIQGPEEMRSFATALVDVRDSLADYD